MIHDATHCANFNAFCPKSCYRAQLTADLFLCEYPYPISWSLFKGTKDCPMYEEALKEVQS